MAVSNITSTATVGSNSAALLANAAMTKISAQIVKLAQYNLRFYDLCDTREQLGSGSSKTVRFNIFPDFALPGSTLSEGVDPAGSTLSSSYVEAVAEQWGDVVAVTDIAELTIKHPIMAVIQDRMARQAGRLIDREIQAVLKAGTNVRYANAAAGRASLATTDILDRDDIKLAVAKLRLSGAEPMDGEYYVGVMTPGVEADLNAFDNFILAKAYAGDSAPLYTGEIGKYLGVRWVRSNFMPILKTTATTNPGATSKAATTGGSLANSTTYYFKVVAREIESGFESVVYAQDSQATGGSDTLINITMPASTSYVYDLYVGTVSGTTYLHSSRNAAAAVVAVSTCPTSGNTAPVTPGTNVVCNTTYIFGKGAYGIVDLQNLQFFMTPDQSLPGNVLRLVRYMGWKVMLKSVILNQNFMVQIESHSPNL